MDSRGGHTTWTLWSEKSQQQNLISKTPAAYWEACPPARLSVQVERRRQPSVSAQPGGEMKETPPGEVQMIPARLLRRHARSHRHEEWIARDRSNRNKHILAWLCEREGWIIGAATDYKARSLIWMERLKAASFVLTVGGFYWRLSKLCMLMRWFWEKHVNEGNTEWSPAALEIC